MKKNFSMKKLYYSISEVSKITDLEQYVLRYWETEFEQLKPAKNLSGNRIYTNKDIQLILHIKKLLREEKYTIEGAKKLLRHYNTKEESEAESEVQNNGNTKKPSGRNELSLFQNEESENESSEDAEQLKTDLKELKNFLNNLLDEI